MAQKSQHTFIGLDTDTADRYMKEGSFRDSLNIHIGSSEGSDMFSVENVKGNTSVAYTLPTGTNQIIGAHEDVVNKCIYFFLYNDTTVNINTTNGITVTTTTPHGLVLSDLVTIGGTSGRTNILGDWIVKPTTSTAFEVLNRLTYVDPINQTMTAALLPGSTVGLGIIRKYGHSILKYNAITNTISLVYKHSRFNFKPAFPVTGTAYLNNILHWTDGFNPPRSMDQTILAAVGTLFNESAFDFIKLPPTEPITLVGKWVDNSGTEIPYVVPNTIKNNMANKSYQFIYRYVYSDNVRSVWSPVSSTIGTGYANAKINKIEVTIPIPLLYGSAVKSIELSFSDDILGGFKFIGKIDQYNSDTNGSSFTYSFYNDTAYSLVDPIETAKAFDSVPKISGSLSTIQNRVFMGDCTEGFDVDTSTFSAINVISEGFPSPNEITFKDGEPYDIGVVFFDRAERKSGVNKLFRTTIDNTGNGNKAPLFVFQGQPPVWATHYMIVRSDCLSKSFFVQGYFVISSQNVGNNTTSVLFNSINGPLSYNAVKGDIFVFSGEEYSIKEISADKFGNPTIVIKGILPVTSNTIGNLQLFFCEIYTPITNKSQLYYETARRFPVKNPGTTQRSFTATNGSNLRMKDWISGDTYYRNLDDSLNYHSRTVLHIETLNLFSGDKLSVTFSNGYKFSVKKSTWDGVEFAEKTAAQAFVDQINTSRYFKAFMLFADYTDINNLEHGIPTGIVLAVARLVVYDKRKGSLGSVNATSTTCNLVPVSRLAGITQAVGRVNGVGAQNFMDNNFVYAMSSTDKDLTWQKNIGRSNIVLVDGDKEIRRSTLIRFGGKFLTDTQINFVNSFDSTDSEPLTNSGAVRKLIAASNNSAEGSILLAIQENEISSCYIGQAIIKNADGNQQVVSTDKVIGTVNPLQKLVGTINPESVVQFNGLVYGFDALKGVVWRYGQNGLDFISDQGMRRFFYERSQYLLSLTSFKCYGGIDPYHNEYILTIPNTDTEKKTIAWSETLNRWTSFMSFAGEWYQKINTHLMSFIGGQTWLHRSGSTFNNFYGVQYKSKLKMICNQEPDTTKILQTVEQKSNSNWDCTAITTPEGQNSELLGLFDLSAPNTYPQDFRKYDNTTYAASVMRDKNTPNLQTSDNPLQNGDVMRSDVFSILMENAKVTQQNLYYVNLKYVPSYKRS